MSSNYRFSVKFAIFVDSKLLTVDSLVFFSLLPIPSHTQIQSEIRGNTPISLYISQLNEAVNRKSLQYSLHRMPWAGHQGSITFMRIKTCFYEQVDQKVKTNFSDIHNKNTHNILLQHILRLNKFNLNGLKI